MLLIGRFILTLILKILAILDRGTTINVGLARHLVITFFTMPEYQAWDTRSVMYAEKYCQKRKNAETPCHVSVWYQLQSDVIFVDPYELDSLC